MNFQAGRTLDVILTAAGSGTRTRGYSDVPKPLIDIHGHPVVSFALAGLPWPQVRRIIFAISEEVNLFSGRNFFEIVRRYVPSEVEIEICVLENVLNGQAYTVDYCVRKFAVSRDLLITNCDTWFSNDFPKDYYKYDGLLGVFESENPAFSYVELDGQRVTRTAEKIVISSHASTGLYYFRDTKAFQDALSLNKDGNEAYIAPLYNSLVNNDKFVGIWHTRAVVPLGTVDELRWLANLSFPGNLFD